MYRLPNLKDETKEIGNQVLYSGVLISLTLHGKHAFTTAGVRLKQKFSFSNICPGRGFNPGSRSIMAVNVTFRLRRNPECSKGPSIYDVHTERKGEGTGSGERMWTWESSPMWTSTQKIKIIVH